MVADRRLYDLLEVPPGASEDELRKAFRKAALKHHPDKGGNAERFKEVSHAYEVLSNPDTRRLYDATGRTDAGGGAGGANPADAFEQIFRNFGFGFPGFPGGPRPPAAAQEPPAEAFLRIQLPLREACLGVTKTFQITEDVPCKSCKGTGANQGNRPICSKCQGQGVITRMERMGPFIQHLQSPCGACEGTGQGPIPAGQECRKCVGGKEKVRETVTLQIPPGVGSGDVIQQRRADGRLLSLEISLVMPPGWQRRGDDLVVRLEIQVVDALFGFRFALEHPNGSTVSVQSPSDRPLEPGASWAMPGLGMPRRGSGRGSLILEIARIQWPPARLAPELLSAWAAHLPASRVQVQGNSS